MRRLPMMVQWHVVVQLARYERPTAVVRDVLERFGLTVTKSQLSHYDPDTAMGKQLAPRWRRLFYEERRRYEEALRRELDGQTS